MISTEFKHTFKIEKLVTFVHVIIEKKKQGQGYPGLQSYFQDSHSCHKNKPYHETLK